MYKIKLCNYDVILKVFSNQKKKYVNRNYVQNLIIMLPQSINSILFHKILSDNCLNSIFFLRS